MKNWVRKSLIGILVILVIIVTACTPKKNETQSHIQIESEIIQLNEDLQINEHDGSFSLNEFIPSEMAEQSSEEKLFNYSKILNEDLSDFTGVWENGRGEKFTLNSDGTFSNMEIPDMDGLVSENSDFFRYEDNVYKWFINFIMEDASFRVSLIPIGAEFIHYNSGIIITNTAKDRIYFEFGGGERFAANNDVYYRNEPLASD